MNDGQSISTITTDQIQMKIEEQTISRDSEQDRSRIRKLQNRKRLRKESPALVVGSRRIIWGSWRCDDAGNQLSDW